MQVSEGNMYEYYHTYIPVLRHYVHETIEYDNFSHA